MPRDKSKIKVGVIGLGYWGPNYVRNFTNHPQAQLVWGCDLSDEALNKVKHSFPKLKITKNFNVLLNDRTIDLIAIATPPLTHYNLVKKALKSLKHVFVAKPLAIKSTQASQLINFAKKNSLLLHGDLTYLYSGEIKQIKGLVKKNVLGRPLYYDSVRNNSFLTKKDINVIWDLAPHDISIISECFNLKPKKIYAVASKHHLQSKVNELAHIIINYSNNFVAHIHLSWLSGIKVRTIQIGGSKKIIFFDDNVPKEKVKIYNKLYNLSPESIYSLEEFKVKKNNSPEPLFSEISDIVAQIKSHKMNYQNARLSLRIISILELCDLSLRKNQPVTYNSTW